MRNIFFILIAMLCLSACEKAPDASRFASPELSEITINVEEGQFVLSCSVSNQLNDDFLSQHEFGFWIENEQGEKVEYPAKMSGKVFSVTLDLSPLDSYTSQAYVRNGSFSVSSNKSLFGTDNMDANFKAYLIDHFDLNKDGSLSMIEIERVREMRLNTDRIVSLNGIEHFANLEHLECVGTDCYQDGTYNPYTGSLSALDVSQNLNLTYLNCSFNNIRQLDLTKNLSLRELTCVENEISELLLPNSSKLQIVNCWMNRLKDLNLSQLSGLRDLRCAQNDFSAGLDVSNNLNLVYLYCNDNKLKSLDVSKNIHLQELGCYDDNDLVEVDVSNNVKLNWLDVRNLPLLERVYMSSSQQIDSLFIDANIPIVRK